MTTPNSNPSPATPEPGNLPVAPASHSASYAIETMQKEIDRLEACMHLAIKICDSSKHKNPLADVRFVLQQGTRNFVEQRPEPVAPASQPPSTSEARMEAEMESIIRKMSAHGRCASLTGSFAGMKFVGCEAYNSDDPEEYCLSCECTALLKKMDASKSEAAPGAGTLEQSELARLRTALERIATCQDAPEIDATGDCQKGLYCGVEDRDCRDRYEGADYGYAKGVEMALEWASNEAKAARAIHSHNSPLKL